MYLISSCANCNQYYCDSNTLMFSLKYNYCSYKVYKYIEKFMLYKEENFKLKSYLLENNYSEMLPKSKVFELKLINPISNMSDFTYIGFPAFKSDTMINYISQEETFNRIEKLMIFK